jgi:Fe-S oxidoreductase
MLDLPKLLLRARAIRTKKNGISFGERMLAETDFVGKIGSATAPLMNWASTNSISRILMEKTIRIHRNKALPKYCAETFASWFKKHQREKSRKSSSSNGRVALFYTCSVNYNYPEIGRAAVSVLEKNNVEVVCPDQSCCGMPHLGAGDFRAASIKIDKNVRTLKDAIEDGCEIVIPGPSCSLIVKQDYPQLASNVEDARKVSKCSFDICEYLMKLHGERKLNTDFKVGLGKIIYHVPCHLRAQNIGLKSRDLMKLIPDTEVEVVQSCSGHDGTWSMKKDFYEMSLKVGDKLFKRIGDHQPSLVVSDCPLSHLHIAQGAKQPSLHPIQVIQKAYGLDSSIS